jgi:hypothetical protein
VSHADAKAKTSRHSCQANLQTVDQRFFRYVTHSQAGDDCDYNMQRRSMLGRKKVLDGSDPEVLEMNRAKNDWDSIKTIQDVHEMQVFGRFYGEASVSRKGVFLQRLS